MEQETKYSPMQLLKRRIYAMRNGIIADTLRKSGCPHRFIFGVNLPQLTEIAAETEHSVEFAEKLWNDSDSRESMMIAPMLYPVESLTLDAARRLASGVTWSEDADILCFKLLRHAPFAAELAAELCASDDRLARYTGLRLYFCTISTNAAQALEAARAELERPDTLSGLASMLAEEARFILGEED